MPRFQIEEIVTRAAHGSSEAFEKLFHIYYADVFAGCLARLRNHADAQNAAQETFIEAWRKLPRLRERKKFPGWLRRITIGRCGRILRRPGPERGWIEMKDSLQSRDADPAVLAERSDTGVLISRSLGALSKSERETMILFLEGHTHAQIAKFQCVPVGTVKRRVHDAKGRLQKAMCDSLGYAIKSQIRRGQTRVDKVLQIKKEGSRMTALLNAVKSATLDAVAEMYRTCDRIEIAEGKINGESVDLDTYEAVVARVKINTNLLGDRFVPGGKSQVFLKFKGVSRDFDAKVTQNNGIVLTLRKQMPLRTNGSTVRAAARP